MALSNNVRYGMYLFLVLILAWFTYSSIIKLLKEDTVLSQHYVEDGAKLPSVTICIKWLSTNAYKTRPYREGRILALPDSENWTFTDFMAYDNVAKNVIKFASFLDQPHDRKS